MAIIRVAPRRQRFAAAFLPMACLAAAAAIFSRGACFGLISEPTKKESSMEWLKQITERQLLLKRRYAEKKIFGSDPIAEAKEALMNMLPEQYDGSIRDRIQVVITRLEKFNPNTEPSYSEVMHGEWVQTYVGTQRTGSVPPQGGMTPAAALNGILNTWGKGFGVAPGLQTVKIHEGGEMETKVEIGDAALEYSSHLIPHGASHFVEHIWAVNMPGPAGSQWKEPPGEMKRGFEVTFLDEDLMVVRDETGAHQLFEHVVT